MDIEIRKAILSDATAMSLLSAQLGYDINTEKTTDHLNIINESSNDIVMVATLHGEVVAWMHIFYATRIETEPFCEIGGLVVNENCRGKGIGKLLIDFAKQWCATKSCNSLRVRTNVKRTDTHKFYVAAGFELAKEQKIFKMNI